MAIVLGWGWWWLVTDFAFTRRIYSDPCARCEGAGHRWYSDGGTWHKPGMATQSFKEDICDLCWGSGSSSSPWLNLREQEDDRDERIRVGAARLLAEAAGVAFEHLRPAIGEIAVELERLSRGRKPRARSFESVCLSLSRHLREMVAAKETSLCEDAGVGGHPVPKVEVPRERPLSALDTMFRIIEEHERVQGCNSCHTCLDDLTKMTRMIVCATCGNKRCPKANDHKNECSGSNLPGQKGSAYE